MAWMSQAAQEALKQITTERQDGEPLPEIQVSAFMLDTTRTQNHAKSYQILTLTASQLYTLVPSDSHPKF